MVLADETQWYGSPTTEPLPPEEVESVRISDPRQGPHGTNILP